MTKARIRETGKKTNMWVVYRYVYIEFAIDIMCGCIWFILSILCLFSIDKSANAKQFASRFFIGTLCTCCVDTSSKVLMLVSMNHYSNILRLKSSPLRLSLWWKIHIHIHTHGPFMATLLFIAQVTQKRNFSLLFYFRKFDAYFENSIAQYMLIA